MDEDIFKIRKDKDRAKDLFDIAIDRFKSIIPILPREKFYKLIEEYYEVIKELLTAVMYLDGCKTLSHVKLIEYFSQNYKELDENEIRLTDNLRKLRIGSGYYGQQATSDFLDNNESEIKAIIKKLEAFVRKKLSD